MKPKENIFQKDEDGGMHAAVVEGPGTYYMAIIDILQEWNWSKKLERLVKIYLKWEDPDGLSAMNPQDYVERFMKRCVNEVFEGLQLDDDYFVAKKKVHMDSDVIIGDKKEAVSSKKRSSTISKTGTDMRFSATPIGGINNSKEDGSGISMHSSLAMEVIMEHDRKSSSTDRESKGGKNVE